MKVRHPIVKFFPVQKCNLLGFSYSSYLVPVFYINGFVPCIHANIAHIDIYVSLSLRKVTFIPMLTYFYVFSSGLLIILLCPFRFRENIFIHLTNIYWALCVQHYARHGGYSGRQHEVPALKKCKFLWNMFTDYVPNEKFLWHK